MAEQHGLIHLYYGDGKGKTTAAFGLALRCAGRGQRVVIAQFLKSGTSGELAAAARLSGLVLIPARGSGKFTFRMNDAEKEKAAQGCLAVFQDAAALVRDQPARLLVLDEVIDACRGFLPMETLTSFLDAKPEGLEVVLTGHSCPKELADRAAYISHIVKEKHPYDQGIPARPDIEF